MNSSLIDDGITMAWISSFPELFILNWRNGISRKNVTTRKHYISSKLFSFLIEPLNMIEPLGDQRWQDSGLWRDLLGTVWKRYDGQSGQQNLWQLPNKPAVIAWLSRFCANCPSTEKPVWCRPRESISCELPTDGQIGGSGVICKKMARNRINKRTSSWNHSSSQRRVQCWWSILERRKDRNIDWTIQLTLINLCFVFSNLHPCHISFSRTAGQIHLLKMLLMCNHLQSASSWSIQRSKRFQSFRMRHLIYNGDVSCFVCFIRFLHASRRSLFSL